MSHSTEHSQDAHGGHDEHGHHEAHIIGYPTLIAVYFVLLCLTGLTIFTAIHFDLPPLPSVFLAIAIAAIKSTVVLLIFMHLYYEKPVFRYMFISTIGTYVIFVLLTFADTVYRY